MQINTLDHINIQTNSLEQMVDWYEKILGLRSGDRPDFPFPGAWLYAGETAIVHLVGRSNATLTGSDVPLRLEHFALSATGRKAFEELLDENDIAFRSSEIEAVGLIQFHINDPEGNHIHVDFPLNE